MEKDICIGDEVTFYWAPNRVCYIRYTGNNQFEVTKSEKTRLLPGEVYGT